VCELELDGTGVRDRLECTSVLLSSVLVVRLFVGGGGNPSDIDDGVLEVLVLLGVLHSLPGGGALGGSGNGGCPGRVDCDELVLTGSRRVDPVDTGCLCGLGGGGLGCDGRSGIVSSSFMSSSGCGMSSSASGISSSGGPAGG
jgi:hypothetical protein